MQKIRLRASAEGSHSHAQNDPTIGQRQTEEEITGAPSHGEASLHKLQGWRIQTFLSHEADPTRVTSGPTRTAHSPWSRSLGGGRESHTRGEGLS
ncbi:hypothetical protein GDO81_019721 [Engystomops pustulosus]|uniref:Uncharacterized protein n=1 Tax=Engystomops pustulosus TaxID=76066 RepID=A0AAV6Z9B5_ENGPU|nr:hypothetical protein GDO81_019721 [Engystomops pustulosus]